MTSQSRARGSAISVPQDGTWARWEAPETASTPILSRKTAAVERGTRLLIPELGGALHFIVLSRIDRVKL
jgi:hypothetical protein